MHAWSSVLLAFEEPPFRFGSAHQHPYHPVPLLKNVLIAYYLLGLFIIGYTPPAMIFGQAEGFPMVMCFLGGGVGLGVLIFAEQKLREKALANLPAVRITRFIIALGAFVILLPLLVVVAALGVVALIGYWIVNHRSPGEKPSDTFGSAHWANVEEIKAVGLARDEGLLLARYATPPERGTQPPAMSEPGPFLRFSDAGHLLTCAATRSGKGVGLVIPNLIAYQGNALVIDLKGENCAVTSGMRKRMGQRVLRLDPFKVLGDGSAALNPLDGVDVESEDAFDEAAKIADMLILREAGERDPHWNDKAGAIIRGLILFVAAEAPAPRRNLLEVRRLLTLPESEFAAMLDTMATTPTGDGCVQRAASEISRMGSNERSSVLSTALRHTEFLESVPMQRVLSHSDFDLAELKRGRLTLYLIMPPDRIERYNRALRLWIGFALSSMVRTPGQPERRTLFLLDEMAQLGPMEPLYKAMSIMGGYGMSLWVIVQNLGQLRALYPEHKWEAFLANATVQQFFGIQDNETAEYISKLSGQTTVITRGSSHSEGESGGSHSFATSNVSESSSSSEAARALVLPHEVIALDPRSMIMSVRGCPAPIFARKINYLEDEEFVGLAAPNPMYLQTT